MMNISKVACVGVLLGLVACGQDPYRDQPESVKNAQGRVLKKPAPEVGSRDLMIDSTSPRYNFAETKEGVIQLVAKALRPHVKFQVGIDNLESFPGATFDQASLTFKWTPPAGFVKSGRTGDYFLSATIVTDKEADKPRMSLSHQVPIAVTKFEPDPEIVSVENFVTEPVFIGDSKSFSVTVRDPGANDSDSGLPRIKIIPQGSSAYGIAHYITGTSVKPTRDQNDPTLWHIPMAMDLTLMSRSRGATDYSFAFIAISPSGKTSKEFPVKVTVVNKVDMPRVSFSASEYFAIPLGKQSEISFSAFDANGEGKISVQINGVETLPGRSSQSCKTTSTFFVMCTVTWDPDATQARGQAYHLEVIVTNSPDWMPETFSQTFDLALQVDATDPVPQNPGQQPPTTTPTTQASRVIITSKGL